MSPAASGSSRGDAIRKARAEGATLRQIGEDVGLSAERVRQILKGPGEKPKLERIPDRNEAQVALAAWLAELHELAGGNVSALARDLGTDRKNIYRWMDGEDPTEPGGATLLQLLEALGVEVKPKPPDQIPKPLSVELADVREELGALVGVVAEIQAELRGLVALVRSQREVLEPPKAGRSTRP